MPCWFDIFQILISGPHICLITWHLHAIFFIARDKTAGRSRALLEGTVTPPPRNSPTLNTYKYYPFHLQASSRQPSLSRSSLSLVCFLIPLSLFAKLKNPPRSESGKKNITFYVTEHLDLASATRILASSLLHPVLHASVFAQISQAHSYLFFPLRIFSPRRRFRDPYQISSCFQ